MVDFVADASVVCSWALPDEDAPLASAAYKALASGTAFAPDLLWHEVRNVLMLAYRRQRISFETVVGGLGALEQLGISIAPSRDSSLILTLAERHRVTAYDAAYLATAVERHLPLATTDKKLAAAATAEGLIFRI